MPNYETFIDGKLRKIELTKTAPHIFVANIDSKPHRIEMKTDKISPDQSLTLMINGKTYKIELTKIEDRRIVPVKVEGTSFNVEVKAAQRERTTTSYEPVSAEPLRKSDVHRSIAVEGAIVAPMTGRIVQVKVKKGEQVKAKQVLCVIEAMKMENEITAPTTGIVKEVNVSAGSSVSEGEILFIVT